MSTVVTSEKIPNNVDLASDKKLQRALEAWQPKFVDWWKQMGPEGFQSKDAYLRTAVSVDAQGWAQFGWVKMPEYRWGIFLAEPEPGRTVSFGDHKGEPAWQEVPGEYRATLLPSALRTDVGLGSLLAGSRTSGYVARRLLGPVLLVPVLLGWSRRRCAGARARS